MRLTRILGGLVALLLVASAAYATDIIGRGDSFRWGFGSFKQLIVQDIEITRPAVGATITVAAEIADVRQITVTLTDADGTAINYAENIEVWVLLNSGGTDFVATGGSTGIAIGASGKLLTIIAKKQFKAITTTAGVVALTWTDTGTEAAFLGIRLPNGRMVISAAMTNA